MGKGIGLPGEETACAKVQGEGNMAHSGICEQSYRTRGEIARDTGAAARYAPVG